MMTGFSFYRFGLIVKKELKLMRRDPASVIVMLVLPVTLIILFGFTVEFNPKHIPTAVVDHDRSTYSKHLLESIEASDYFDIQYRNVSDEKASELMDSDDVKFILSIPKNFSQKLLKGQPTDILFEANSILPMGMSSPLEVVEHAAAYGLKHELKGALKARQSQKPLVSVVKHYIYNPDLSSRISIIPNTIGLVLMLSMLMLTNVTSFRDRNEGTFDSLTVSPMMSSEIILGGVFAYILVGYLQLTVGLLLAKLIFDVPMLGHVSLIYVAILPYLVAELSLGMLLAVTAKTQLQAIQVSNLFVAMAMILSGFIFPYWGIPEGVRWLSEMIPLTHALRILQDVMLKGLSASYLVYDVFCLIVFCSLVISMAIYCYHRKIHAA